MPSPYTLQDIGGLHGGDVLKGFLSKSLDDDGDIIGNQTGGTTLAAPTAAGASAVVVGSTTPTLLVGAFIAIGAGTTHCEVRRVTAIVGTAVTLDTSAGTGGGLLVAAHSAGENIYVLGGTLVPPAWFGCQANDSTFDSYAGLKQFFNDSALTGGFYGLDGGRARYYVTRPVNFYDGNTMEEITITAKSDFLLDAKLGKNVGGLPNQFLGTLAGQFLTISSVDTAANTITLSASPGAALDEQVAFYPAFGSTLPAPLEEGRSYFTRSVAGSTVTIAVDEGGSALDLTTAGSGTIYCYSLGAARRNWKNVRFEGADIQALNGLRVYTQQPDRAIGLRCENFPGPMGNLWWKGQQGETFGLQLFNGYKGLNARSLEFGYSLGNNFELCDILAEFGNDTQAGSTALRDVRLYGTHFEQPGNYSAQVQSITKSGTVSGGTYTLSFKGETTGVLNYNDNAVTIQTALEALASINVGDITVADVTGGPSAGGYAKIDFRTANGQYAYRRMKSAVNERITVNVGSLTGGGSYVMSYVNPDGRGASVVTDKIGSISFYGGVWSGGVTFPDGTAYDFLTVETGAGVNVGYDVDMVSIGLNGWAINDLPTGLQIPWNSSVGVGRQRLKFYKGGTDDNSAATQKNWYLASKSTKHIAWEEANGEWRYMNGAKARFGDTGPIITSGAGTPEGAVTAPVGSFYLRTDGGAATSVYVKESGAGNTGWVGK